ncbi:MAG TPA: LuxR C-terminal-related transcriptional regulator [Solirubrobacteraceae bacterium]|jgi:DNA-binding CsgD family transcriptional regulator
MSALRTSDLRAVLEVAWSLGEAEDLPAFREAALALCPRLVEGDVCAYNEVPADGSPALVMMDHYPAGLPWWDAVGRLRDEHPLVLHFLATGSGKTIAISDLMSRRAFEGSEFYREVLSYCDGRDQLAVSMGPPDVAIGFAVNRRRRGFSARDHEVLDALRPFLVQARRRVTRREHTSGELTVPALRELGLTRREAEVLARVALGETNAAIATALGSSPLTVAKQLTRVYEKLGVPNRTAAVRAARERLGL